MINDNNSFPENENKMDSSLPQSEEFSTDAGESKRKQYGKKSLSPLIDLVHRYRSEIDPYVAAIGKGLDGAVNSFEANNSEAERVVSGWFRDTSTWFNGAKEKLNSQNPGDLLRYFEDVAKKSPGLMFSSSYMIGLIFGKLGRHIVRAKTHSSMNSGEMAH